MTTSAPQKGEKSQADKFKEAARKHEADENEAAWEARLKKIATPKTPKNREKSRSTT